MDALAVDSESRSSTRFAAKRSALLGDIDAYLREVTNHKTHLNTLTHVGQMPSEVLAEILVAYARDCYRAAARDRSWSATSPVWVMLAHVCRHWREVAFDTPRFWSYVDVKKPKAFFALIPLSKSSPLSIDLTLDQHNWTDVGTCMLAIELIGKQSHRLRELHFVAKSKHVRTLLGHLSHRPMPLLETLVISDRGGGDLLDDSHPFHILPTRQAPRLCHLELHRLPFVWTDPAFSSTLTTLVVVKAYRRDDSPVGTFEQFMDALKAMAPSLVNLTLEDAVPRLQSRATQPPLARGHSIALPALQTLRILCNTNDCVHLMDHVSINPAAIMDITGNSGTGPGIERLVEVVSAHASRSTPLLGLKISSPHSMSGVSISGHNDGDLKNVDFEDLGALNLTLGTFQAAERPLTTALRAANTLFSRVQSLSILLESSSDSEVPWSSLFACTPSVETLEIVGNPGTGFFKALCDVRDVQNESSATSAPLLRLRELKLNDWRSASRHCDGGFFDNLRDWVILRCNYGIPLERLQVCQCKHTAAKDIRRLGEIVVQVDSEMGEPESTDEEEDEDDEDFCASRNYHSPYGWY